MIFILLLSPEGILNTENLFFILYIFSKSKIEHKKIIFFFFANFFNSRICFNVKQNFFPKYETKKIEEINYNKNKKIKIGFVSSDFVGDHTCTFFTKKTINSDFEAKIENFHLSLSQIFCFNDNP